MFFLGNPVLYIIESYQDVEALLRKEGMINCSTLPPNDFSIWSFRTCGKQTFIISVQDVRHRTELNRGVHTRVHRRTGIRRILGTGRSVSGSEERI
jgi:hypothetical protein